MFNISTDFEQGKTAFYMYIIGNNPFVVAWYRTMSPAWYPGPGTMAGGIRMYRRGNRNMSDPGNHPSEYPKNKKGPHATVLKSAQKIKKIRKYS